MNLKKTLEQHALWLIDSSKGERANLSGANLYLTIGNNREVRTLQLGTFTITHTKDVVQIGCKQFTYREWLAFSADDLNMMDREALAFYSKWGTILMQILEATYEY